MSASPTRTGNFCRTERQYFSLILAAMGKRPKCAEFNGLGRMAGRWPGICKITLMDLPQTISFLYDDNSFLHSTPSARAAGSLSHA